MRTHYENLHVTEDAPDEVIRASYRALSLKHHPDTAGDKPQSQWKMQRINDSYAVLSESQKKAAYDGELRRQRNPRPAQAVRCTSRDSFDGHHLAHRLVEHQRLIHFQPKGLLTWKNADSVEI